VTTIGEAYSGSLSTNVARPLGDLLTFSKLSGPAWLQVTADSNLHGTPGLADLGTNVFTVNLSDTNGWSSSATMFVCPTGGIRFFHNQKLIMETVESST